MMNSITLLYYDRIELSEGTHVNKKVNQKSAIFATIGIIQIETLSFNVCNGYHDLLMKPMNLSNIKTLNQKSADYYCIISKISKSEAINLTQNTDFAIKKENIIKLKNLFYI